MDRTDKENEYYQEPDTYDESSVKVVEGPDFDCSKYLALIEGSQLFSLEKGSSAYRREAYKMVEYLFCYLLGYDKRRNQEYGSEIVSVATRCIANFEPRKGVFFRYFLSAWKQELKHLESDRRLDVMFRGLKVTDSRKRDIIRFLEFEKHHPSASKDRLYQIVSEALDISIQEVCEIANLSKTTVMSDTIQNKDGEDISLWDHLDSDEYTVEDVLLSDETLKESLDTIERVFSSLQNRQKPIVADILTIRIWSLLDPNQREGLQYSFINRDLLNECLTTGTPPTQRDIAERHGRDEASISRTAKEFLNKLSKSFLWS